MSRDYPIRIAITCERINSDTASVQRKEHVLSVINKKVTSHDRKRDGEWKQHMCTSGLGRYYWKVGTQEAYLLVSGPRSL